MAEGGGSNTGKFMAGCGCLTWLACVLLIVVFSIVPSLLPYDVVSSLGPVLAIAGPITWGGACCATLSFFVAVIGVILMLMGNRSSMDDI